MRRILISAFVLAASMLTVDASRGGDRHVVATLNEVDGSGVGGKVVLHALHGGGTRITVVATGLKTEVEYISIYYDNGDCTLEADSQNDVFARYRGNERGTARVTGVSDDDLDEIHSVSVRLGDGLALQACAAVNP
jgi:hypothetical protein